MNETRSFRLRPILGLSLALALAACSGAAEEPPLKGASIGGPFALTDQDGRPVTERDFAGRYRIMYFGFTHCPDICPTDLAIIGQALRRFEKSDPARAARVAPIFVSVDPERDTPAVLKEYVAAFHPRLVGLTGTKQQVADTIKRYGAYGAKDPAERSGGYNVNHSRLAELIGPDGKPIALLPYDKGAEAVAAELDRVGAMNFWDKPLAALDRAEWEALCDGCGKCCLHKLEDEDTGQIHATNVACRLLDRHTARCTNYRGRKAYVPDCVRLTSSRVGALAWLPSTCAYRLRSEGKPLPGWHYLVCGDREAVHRAGASIRGWTVAEDEAGDLEHHLVEREL